jgi:hypothetical protein
MKDLHASLLHYTTSIKAKLEQQFNKEAAAEAK